jgi:hypothetical protein
MQSSEHDNTLQNLLHFDTPSQYGQDPVLTNKTVYDHI